ncbi:MAG: class I SAM-dependent methyltransferase [Alphaproteobacteria bacterium]
MAGFDPSWLALREPYDHAVRDRDLTRDFVDALGPSPELIDLGSGTGSNLRFLAPHLPPTQRWTCVDHDPRLLACLAETRPAGIAVASRTLDLARELGELSIRPGVGITAAALLDLTSAAWLDALIERCRDMPMLMTLSFDGRMVWDPVDPSDEAVNAAFNRHQCSDKGFGPALGPDAASYLAERLRGDDRDVRVAPSDWVFGADDGSILQAMVDGIAAAAGEIDPTLPLEAWRARRCGEIDEKRLALTVGHLDVLALPK